MSAERLHDELINYNENVGISVDDKKTLEEVEDLVKEKFKESKDPAHSWEHVHRVVDNAVTICRDEGGDEFLVKLSALLHDLGRIRESHGEHEYPHAVYSIFEGHKINEDLYNRGLLQLEQWRKVSSAVAKHSKLLSEEERTQLIDILQDADRLDAFGLDGMSRNFFDAKRRGLPIYTEGEPLDYPEDQVFNIKDVKSAFSDLFFVHGFKNVLSSDTSKKMAEPGILIVEDFINLIRNRINKNEMEGYDFWLEFIDYAKKQGLERVTEDDVKNFIKEYKGIKQ